MSDRITTVTKEHVPGLGEVTLLFNEPAPASNEPAPAAATPKTTRTKRSWSRVTVPLRGGNFTFWPTPDGLFRRLKGSPKVRSKTWPEINDCLNDRRFEFHHDGRDYTVWPAPEGLHVVRNDVEEKLIPWPHFVEWVDGQKLLPL
jgi:hypothetical protein